MALATDLNSTSTVIEALDIPPHANHSAFAHTSRPDGDVVEPDCVSARGDIA